MTVSNFNQIKKDIESGFTIVQYQEGVVVGKPLFFVINETKFVAAHFSKKQLEYLTRVGTKKSHLLSSYRRIA